MIRTIAQNRYTTLALVSAGALVAANVYIPPVLTSALALPINPLIPIAAWMIFFAAEATLLLCAAVCILRVAKIEREYLVREKPARKLTEQEQFEVDLQTANRASTSEISADILETQEA